MTDVFMFLFCISLLLWLIYVIKFNDMLLKKIDLQQRIDKAIFFISTTFDNYLIDDYIKNNLLEILKGDSNE